MRRMRWRSPFFLGALIGLVLIVLTALPSIVLGYTNRIPIGARLGPGPLGPGLFLLALSGLAWLALTLAGRVNLRPDPLHVLQERYVRGELKQDDYLRMRDTLLDERR